MQQAKTADFGPFDAPEWKIGIVVARFNADITESLLQSALARAKDYKISPDNITVLEVAGSVEIPLALQSLAETGQYDALLSIGCVIKGETPHFDYVCKFATEGVLRVQLDYHMPIGFGVITCNTPEQAEARKHLGGDHLDATLHLAQAISPSV